jgi:ATP/maltotriose-dependent transcriptional regulator MalT
MCLGHSSWIRAILGYLEQADAAARASLTLARELQHPLSEVMALICATPVAVLRGEPDRARRLSLNALELAQEHGFPVVSLHGQLGLWQAALWKGEIAGEALPITTLIEMLEAVGFRNVMTANLSLAGRHRLLEGAPEQALELFEQSLQTADATGERYQRSDSFWGRGQALLALGRPDEAELSFQEGIQIARRRKAKLFELNASMSLVRLWQSQGKRREAHELLAPVYEWFTEGLDTMPLREARELLEELTA